MSEHTVSLFEDAERLAVQLESNADAHQEADGTERRRAAAMIRALIPQPTAVEDMVPGTRFTMLQEQHWTVLPHRVAIQDGAFVGRYLEEFDRSTILDVKVPSE